MSGLGVLGIDVGLTGGLAVIHPHDGIWLEPMPVVDGSLDVQELVRLISDQSHDLRVAYVESIFAIPKSGAHSMMVFGKSYGTVIGILTALNVPIVEVRPQTWMKVMHTGVSTTVPTKMRSTMAFLRLFPGLDARRTAKSKTPDMGLVEATLIAEYGRRDLGC